MIIDLIVNYWPYGLAAVAGIALADFLVIQPLHRRGRG